MSSFPHQEEEHPFYGHEILADQEQAYIQLLLKKYRGQPANEELKKKIWDELQNEKYLGNLKIPFKVVLRRDQTGKFPSFVEVILDTKV
jgi:hypothetical protein